MGIVNTRMALVIIGPIWMGSVARGASNDTVEKLEERDG